MRTYAEFVTEQIHPDLQKHIDHFKKWGESHEGRRALDDHLSKVCHEPGSCSQVSHEFSKHLQKHGVPHKIVTVHDPKNKEWHKAVADDGSHGSHTAVQVGHHVVDFTRRQFERHAPLPHVQHADDFKREWHRHDE